MIIPDSAANVIWLLFTVLTTGLLLKTKCYLETSEGVETKSASINTAAQSNPGVFRSKNAV